MTSFDLKDLGMAYRKAKVDLYYSSHPRLTDIACYEENLHTNLSALLEKSMATMRLGLQRRISLAHGRWPLNPSIWRGGKSRKKKAGTD